ncbi:MAG: signal peptidase I, partial [Proteobacteria bacterium]|nr:signal peptidase I [Pseudomonadota bacterium]
MVKDKNDKKARSKSAWREWIEAIVIAVILALFIRTFLVQAYKIPSGSMEPTLLVGDQVLVCKFWYGLRVPFTDVVLFNRLPKRGDIIVFKPPHTDEDFIKRVVGLPGDVIEFRNRTQIWIKPPGGPKFERFKYLEGPHVDGDTLGNHKYTVPAGKLFVMGDNRDNSQDSRFWGVADIKHIRGKAFMIYWSWYGWSENTKLGWKNDTTYGVRWYRLNPFHGYVWIPGVRSHQGIDRRFPAPECDYLRRRAEKDCLKLKRAAAKRCGPNFDQSECRDARDRAQSACRHAQG